MRKARTCRKRLALQWKERVDKQDRVEHTVHRPVLKETEEKDGRCSGRQVVWWPCSKL